MYFGIFLPKQDSRIEGGYESVPTRDIHMKSVGFQEEYLEFLEVYVQPLQEAAFIGYASEVGFSFVCLFYILPSMNPFNSSLNLFCHFAENYIP